MCREFITRFKRARLLERKPNVLRDVKQGESETLKEYVERFHKEEQLKLKKATKKAKYGSKKEKGKGKEENQGDQNGHPMITSGIPRLQPRGRDQLKAPILQPQPVMNVPNEMHPKTLR
ncbi:hypothetical protein LWI29_032808 [Acer saccharum]|uniref:Retrotransposon gag domain-containing protein n=1 Tax=Acer saccharum TaxID=4024 RepID=A0AA39SVU5_ACESA|nr:hypothetical protein LWI29_032808 [Acer saccharum]